MPKKLSTAEFVLKAKNIHGDKYDYSETIYRVGHAPITIICSKHGPFQQTPENHLGGHGCRECGGNSMKNTLLFVRDAKLVHGEEYDYSKADYRGNKHEIIIICKTHGKFHQTPNSHLRGQGCPVCGRLSISDKIKSTKEKFILSARQVHGNRYDYSEVTYGGNRKHVSIICKKHGKFLQRPMDHLAGCGCQKCFGCPKKTLDAFIKQSKIIHGNKYDYSETLYNGNKIPVTIKCSIHGRFKVWPNNHIKGAGCPECYNPRVSKSETRFLDYINVPRKNRQYVIEGVGRVDGINKKKMIVYEFLGDFWHGNPKIYPPNKINNVTKNSFGELYSLTNLRMKKLRDLGYHVNYIWESDWCAWCKTKNYPIPVKKFQPM
jgi:hypothetical protein